MAGPIGEAFVRVRPDTSSFKSETAAGVRSGLVGAAKLVGGIFAVTGAVEAAKAVVRAAASEQAELAAVRRSVQDTDRVWEIHGKTVSEILTKQARDSGFSTEEVARSFIRVEAGAQNTAKALGILSLAENVARGRHIELAQASLILSRVQQGSDTALRRLGIIIPKVTSAQDALKKEHTAGIAAGVKFTDAQKEQYKTSLAQAKALDAQASRTRVLDEVQRRFGGQSQTFAKTAAGEFARLRENIRQFEASLGAGALPVLNQASEGLIHLTNELRTSEGVHHTVASAVNAFASAVQAGASALEFIAPGLRLVVDLVDRLGQFTGVGGLVTLVAGFKSVGAAVELVRVGQAKYAAILAASRGGQTATAASADQEAVAFTALTAAVERNTLALTANLAASERGALALSGGLGTTAANVAQVYGSLGQTVATETAAINTAVASTASATQQASTSLLDTAANASQVVTALESGGSKIGATAQAASLLSDEVDGLAASQGRLGASFAGTESKQAAVAASAKGEAAAYAALTQEIDVNTGALTANVAAAERSATVLGAGVTQAAVRSEAALQGVSTSLAASSGSQLLAAEALASSAQDAGADLLAQAESTAIVTDRSFALAERLKNTGGAAVKSSADLAGLTSTQVRHTAAVEQSIAPERAAAAALTAQATSYDALATSAGAATAATSSAAGVATATAAEGAALAQAAEEAAAYDAAIKNVTAANLAYSASAVDAGVVATQQARMTVTAAEAQAGALATSAAWAGTWTQAMEGHGQATTDFARDTEVAAASALGMGKAARTTKDELAHMGDAAIKAGPGLGSLAAKEVELASGARLLVPATAAAEGGLKVVGEQAEKTGLRAAGIGGKFKTLGAGLFALAGGWVTVAAAAIAAVGFLIFKFITADSALERANQRLSTSLENLASDFQGVAKAAKDYAAATSSIKTDRIAVSQARLSLEQARTALSTTDAKKGTIEYSQALLSVQQAVDQYRLALKQQDNDEKAASAARRSRAEEFKKAQADIRASIRDTVNVIQHAEHDTTGFFGKVRDFLHQDVGPLPAANPFSSVIDAVGPKPGAIEGMERFADSLKNQAKALRDSHPFFARQLEDFGLITRALGEIPPQKIIEVFLRTGSARAAIRELIGLLNAGGLSLAAFTTKVQGLELALEDSDPKLSKQVGLVNELIAAIGHAPSKKVTNLILTAKDFKSGVTAAIAELERINGVKPGSKAADEFAAAFIAQLKAHGLVNSVKDAVGSITSAVAGVDAVTAKSLASAGAVARQARTSVKQIGEQVAQQAEAVAQATRQVIDSQQSLADAIRTGNQSIRDSVSSASQNLFSIGESLAGAIDKFIDAQNRANGLLEKGSPAAKEFGRLTEQLKKGEGGAEVERSARALEGRLEAESVAQKGDLDKRKERVHTHIADLVDEFNKGAISLKDFNKRLAKILAGEGITYRAAGHTLGIAFADGFNAVVKGLRDQAAAIAAGPRFKGVTGLEPEIVRPLEAVRDAARQIKEAQRNVADSLKEQGKAQRELSSLSARAAKLRTDLVGAEGRLETLQERMEKLISKQAKILESAQANAEKAQKAAVEKGVSFGILGGFNLGVDLGGGLPKGFKAAEKAAITGIVALIESILGAARNKARAKSPSEATADLGRDMGLGLARGLTQSKAHSARAAEDLVTATLRGARAAGARASDEARQQVAAELSRHLSVGVEAVAQLPPFKPPIVTGDAERRLELLGESRLTNRIGRMTERHLGIVAAESKKQTIELRRLGSGKSPGGGEKKPRGSASRNARLVSGI